MERKQVEADARKDLNMMMSFVFLFVIAFVIILIAGISAAKQAQINEEAKRRAGKEGEDIAASEIRSVLLPGDIMLRNVPMYARGQRTELDNVIINDNGIFIIEVKNYSGTLYGEEDDEQWEKCTRSRSGQVYRKTVKNPIRQMERQVHITANYLNDRHCSFYMKGYAYLVRHNSPVDSEMILGDRSDIDRVLHTPGRYRLSPEAQAKAARLFQAAC